MRFLKILSCLLILTISACQSTGDNGLSHEKEGALKGSLARTIIQVAWDYHQQHQQWPDLDYLTRYSGLTVHNRLYNNDFGIYILQKPYDNLPANLKKDRTFSVCWFYSHQDSSRHVSCSIYYSADRQSPPFAVSVTDGEQAALWSLQMYVQKTLLAFLKEALTSTNLDNLAVSYASTISEVSPFQAKRPKLAGLIKPILLECYLETKNLNDTEIAFQNLLDQYSRQLASDLLHRDFNP
ncbi:MAG: hypothetical protein PHO91_01785 [Patescibacteria group bacterium]|nr:hypothetical protein [Patescibacteria group bacterium]